MEIPWNFWKIPWNVHFCLERQYAKTMSNYPTDKPFEPTERYMCILSENNVS